MKRASKILGNKEKFAIQYKITEVINQFVYGHICYWINGIMIGDFDAETIISDVWVFLPQIVWDNGKREHESFFQMSKEEVLYLLGGQAYLDDKKYEELALEETWARFNIAIGLNVFCSEFVKLIDNKNMSRIVFMDNEDVLHEFYLDRGIVDDVFSSFSEELDRLVVNDTYCVSVNNLCKKLNLPKPHKYCQDWEDEVRDSKRIEEFIVCYEKEIMDRNEKIILMEIILNSCDEALYTEDFDEDCWKRVEDALIKNRELHIEAIKYWSLDEEYWSCKDDEDEENYFAITPRIRKIKEVIYQLSGEEK